MAVEGLTTLGESTLASGYTAASGTMALISGASFPAAGLTFSVRVAVAAGGAIYSCTRSSDTLTVTLESGSDVNVSSGVAITEVLTSRSIYDLLLAFNRFGALASLPATLLKNGMRYGTSDGLYDYLVTSGAWQAFYGSRAVTPPVSGNFSWVNQVSASVSAANGGLTITGPGVAGINIQAQVVSLPSAPFTIDMLIAEFTLGSGANFNGGVILRESGTGKLETFGSNASVGINTLSVTQWNSPTSFANAAKNATLGVPFFPNGWWVRITNDNTNLKCWFSTDGTTWVEFYSEAVGAFFSVAPNQIGIYFDSETTGNVQQMVTLIHIAGL